MDRETKHELLNAAMKGCIASLQRLEDTCKACEEDALGREASVIADAFYDRLDALKAMLTYAEDFMKRLAKAIWGNLFLLIMSGGWAWTGWCCRDHDVFFIRDVPVGQSVFSV